MCENFLAGAPASEWDVPGAGDATIQGFATSISVNQGETVRFKIKTPASSYRLDIYRMGYYGGMGARKVATVTPSAALPQTQPACLTAPATGLVDCGNWAESASWPVPATATSGIYFAKLVRIDTGGASHIVFVVRDDDGQSEFLFQTSDTTWQAYNTYGGNSLYVGAAGGPRVQGQLQPAVQHRAPRRGGPQESWLFNAEYPMVRWLEANGYNVSYSSGVDTDRRGAEILEHQMFLSVGHDEYWSGAAAHERRSGAQRRHPPRVLQRQRGVLEDAMGERSPPGNAYRTLVCYKETHRQREDRSDRGVDGHLARSALLSTGRWRPPRERADRHDLHRQRRAQRRHDRPGGRRQAALLAQHHRRDARGGADRGPADRHTRIRVGRSLRTDASRPAGLLQLSSTTLDVDATVPSGLRIHVRRGYRDAPPQLYRHSSGALVFGAGTVQWSWGLDANHDRPGPAADVRMRQATVNLFADMGAQAGTLQPGLVGGGPSLDTLTPTTTITSPAAGATVQSGAPMTITGTAIDNGGGVVGAVEVSTDNGATWHVATGRASWSYVWTPFTPGSSVTTVTIRSRAIDDSLNMETPGAGVTVSINPGPRPRRRVRFRGRARRRRGRSLGQRKPWHALGRRPGPCPAGSAVRCRLTAPTTWSP